MSQRDGFSGGFFLGTLVGGILGGVVGTILASRQKKNFNSNQQINPQNKSILNSSKLKKIKTEESLELARQQLEDKIANLNLAIDDVCEQLGANHPDPTSESSESEN